MFDTQNINNEVSQKSVRAGVANLISQALLLVITLARAAVLARLLSPDDYGVFTMVIVIISFSLIFKDLGLSTATIREKEITHKQVSNLFWINTAIGFLSMIVVSVLAPGIVWFYDDSRLALIALVLSVAFFFGGITVQHQALLKRQMQFGKIAVINICANIASSVIGIIVAWELHNYWALIWMNVLNNLFLMIGFWCGTRWMPCLPSKRAGTKQLLRVGFDVAGLNAFSTLTQNFDKIITGRIADSSLLGLYSKGNQVPDLISGQFRLAFFSVALPALSSLQNEKERFSHYYFNFLNLICWVTMPLAVMLFVFADEIILLYFGPKWSGSVNFMKIFAVHSFIVPAVTTLDQIPLALGHSRRYLSGGIVRSLGIILCVAIGAVLYGAVGVAIGVVIANLITFIPFSSLCVKGSSIRMKDYFKTICFPLFTSIGVGALFYCYKSHYINDSLLNDLLFMMIYMMVVLTCLLIYDLLRIGHHVGIVDYLFNRKRA